MMKTIIMDLIPEGVMPRQKKKSSFLCLSPAWPAYLEKVTCKEPCEPVVQFTIGTMIGSVSTCTNRHSSQWDSQKCHHGMPWSNLLLAGSMVSNWINTAKCMRLFRHLQCPQSLHQPSTKSSQPMLFKQLCLPGISVRLSCSTSMREGHLH